MRDGNAYDVDEDGEPRESRLRDRVIQVAVFVLVLAGVLWLAGCEARAPDTPTARDSALRDADPDAALPPRTRGLLVSAAEPGIWKITEVGVSLDFDWLKLTPNPDSQRLKIMDSSASAVIHHNSKVTASHTTKTVSVPAAPIGRVYRVCLSRWRSGANLTPACVYYKLGAGVLIPVEPAPIPPVPVPSARFDSVVIESVWPPTWGGKYDSLVGYDVKSWRRDTSAGVLSIQDIYVDDVRVANDQETGLYVTGYVPRKAKGTTLQLRICARVRSGTTTAADSSCSRTKSYLETRDDGGTPPPPPPPPDTTTPGPISGDSLEAIHGLLPPVGSIGLSHVEIAGRVYADTACMTAPASGAMGSMPPTYGVKYHGCYWPSSRASVPVYPSMAALCAAAGPVAGKPYTVIGACRHFVDWTAPAVTYGGWT